MNPLATKSPLAPMPPLALRAPRARRPVRGLGRGAVARASLTLGAAALLALALQALPAHAQSTSAPPARAEEARPALRGDVVATSDVVTLGEIIANVPPDLAARPLFRAPALGATGTIQARRIAEATVELGLGPVETGGRLQITVQRAARRIGAGEIEGVLKRALATRTGLDPQAVTINFDGELPHLLVPPSLTEAATAVETSYDPRSRRITALVIVGARQASLRVSGTVVETVEVAVLTRSLAKGTAVQAGDLTLERRPRDGLPGDLVADASALPGQVAQRALASGAAVRAGDLARPELVARGEVVTIVFETPGISLALRGKANEGGALGDPVGVVNPVTKKSLQGTVIGPGRVAVGPAPGRLASAGQP